MVSPRPFRFGLALAGFDHGHDWAETARRVEDRGYATMLVPDHLGDQLAPLPAIAAAAAATSRLRIGTFVLANDFRHPVLLAKEAATVDVLSGGRLELGLGAGWRREEFDAAGITFASGAERLARLEESISVLRGLWGGEDFSFSGDHYRIAELVGRPRPTQAGGPPLFLGGGGPRMLDLAARVANIVGIAPRSQRGGTLDLADVSAERTEAKVAVVRDAAGGRFADIELNVLILAARVGPGVSAQDQAEEVARRWHLGPEDVLASPHAVLGPPEQVIEALHRHRERFGISYVTVPEPALDAFAPVVERLAGN